METRPGFMLLVAEAGTDFVASTDHLVDLAMQLAAAIA